MWRTSGYPKRNYGRKEASSAPQNTEIDFTDTHKKYQGGIKINHFNKNDMGGVFRGVQSSGGMFIVFDR
jgi:hypothetical protein